MTGVDSSVPQLLALFGGRQTARLMHFAAASGLVLFVIVHLVIVLVSGVSNNLRDHAGNPHGQNVRFTFRSRSSIMMDGLAPPACIGPAAVI
jgi:hypothetical protein